MRRQIVRNISVWICDPSPSRQKKSGSIIVVALIENHALSVTSCYDTSWINSVNLSCRQFASAEINQTSHLNHTDVGSIFHQVPHEGTISQNSVMLHVVLQISWFIILTGRKRQQFVCISCWRRRHAAFCASRATDCRDVSSAVSTAFHIHQLVFVIC